MSGWSCGITTVWGRPLVPATTSIPVQSRQGNPQVLTDLACQFVGDFRRPRYTLEIILLRSGFQAFNVTEQVARFWNLRRTRLAGRFIGRTRILRTSRPRSRGCRRRSQPRCRSARCACLRLSGRLAAAGACTCGFAPGTFSAEPITSYVARQLAGFSSPFDSSSSHTHTTSPGHTLWVDYHSPRT